MKKDDVTNDGAKDAMSRQRRPNYSPPLPPPPNRRHHETVTVLVIVDIGIVLTALLGLYVFASSFFLAKHSLPHHRSTCDNDAPSLLRNVGLSEISIDKLQSLNLMYGGDSNNDDSVRPRNGCWMDRRADAVVILLVDALRIDFVQQLTTSVQSRLKQQDTSSNRLFRFVADPPTVTTQRIKALTTGGLPTFADISSNFGGATVEDDNWLHQLQHCPVSKRGYSATNSHTTARIGFVGDDTWMDLYPTSFVTAHPYPSFNTRDLDTVDNGCLHHLPSLLDTVRTRTRRPSSNNHEEGLEVTVVHFLGVDHVGHTYGPLNDHMDVKLAQMDETIDYVLTYLDNSNSASCHIVLVFGDHGMTSDGNHGGGTIEEVSAGLFVHATPGCGGLMKNADDNIVASIHQIDLVPTLSYLLGIPIPFANLGRTVTAMMPMPPQGASSSTPHHRLDSSSSRTTAVATALNAGQVWRYLNTYRHEYRSSLPDLMDRLGPSLKRAVKLLEIAVAKELEVKKAGNFENSKDDDVVWVEAGHAFHEFLGNALELGQQAWTQFDTTGMVTGIVVLALALVAFVASSHRVASASSVSLEQPAARTIHAGMVSRVLLAPLTVETVVAITFVLYHCGVLTFSNSYILEEQRSLQFAMGALCCAMSVRWSSNHDSAYPRHPRPKDKPPPTPLLSTPPPLLPLLIPLASRLHELLVSGHGLDPSIRFHAAHSSAAFLPSLVVLIVTRWGLHQRGMVASRPHWIADSVSMAALGASWWEKRSVDPSRNGFVSSRIAVAITGAGLLLLLLGSRAQAANQSNVHRPTCIAILTKLLIILMAVTGPSTAGTVVLYSVQVAALYLIHSHLSAFVTATLIKLITRHAFFATNHACFFNRLQYSAAFVATTEFNFFTGGLSLFLNTFGWELAGILLCLALRRRNVWMCYVGMQLVEALCSCVSVSLLRRHLMVWDIYAPHFLFTSIFTILTCLSHVSASILSL